MASTDKRPNGGWRARWREYPGGPQKTRSFDRKVEAERFLVDVQHRLLSGTYVAPEHARTTVDVYAEAYMARQAPAALHDGAGQQRPRSRSPRAR